mgnify:CR=1 FL=1
MFHLTDQLRLAQLDRGVIRLATDIDDMSVSEFLAEFAYVSAQPAVEAITLEIMCPGGECYAAFAAYDVIIASPKPVMGVVMGYAASSAAMIILQACSPRMSYPSARFLIHEIQELSFGTTKLSSAEDNTRELNAVQDAIIEILSHRTGKASETIKALIQRREYWLGAEEALEFGLIDNILGPLGFDAAGNRLAGPTKI